MNWFYRESSISMNLLWAGLVLNNIEVKSLKSSALPYPWRMSFLNLLAVTRRKHTQVVTESSSHKEYDITGHGTTSELRKRSNKSVNDFFGIRPDGKLNPKIERTSSRSDMSKNVCHTSLYWSQECFPLLFALTPRSSLQWRKYRIWTQLGRWTPFPNLEKHFSKSKVILKNV